MASYSQDVKDELARIFDADIDSLRAEFTALLQIGAKKIDGRLEFANINAAVARKVIVLAKKILPLVKPEVATIRRKRLRKDMTYVVRFIAAGEVQTFFDAPDFDELLKRTRYKISYLRGVFLARGMVSHPEGDYFLSITSKEAEARFVQRQMIKLDFKAGIFRHKKEFIVWLKEADSIFDFLAMLGADNTLERFEVARNIKEIRRQVSRAVNRETASLNKAIDAAQRQLADIKILIDNNVAVDEKLRQAMELRLEDPTGTLTELGEKLSLTRAGLRYRFCVIHRLAQEYTTK